MLKLILLFTFVCYIVRISADNLLGPGLWSLISVGKCDIKLEEEVITGEFYKHKLNRTHDGISGDTTAFDVIGDNYGALVEICKYVDGGCKQYQVLSDKSVVNMLKQYAKEENIINALKLANVDPPEFPVPKGEYHLRDFVMNYCLLPRDGFYGDFEGVAYVMRGFKKVACFKAVLEFNKFDYEEYCN